MKLLLLLFLGVVAPATAQVLPKDSLSGRVAYRGVVKTPNASPAELFSRAKMLSLTSIVPAVVSESDKSVASAWEKPLSNGRSLRYTAVLTIQPDGYRYVLSDFENKTGAVHYAAAPGVMGTAAGGTAPIERVLANPSGYRNGKPTAALLKYQAEVSKAAEQAVADLRQRMKP